MELRSIIKELNLEFFTQDEEALAKIPTGGYASDLLSCVMAGAKHGNIWVTLQCHVNIVAVAAVLDLCAIIITEGAKPDPITLEKAKQQSILLLGTTESTYAIVGKLWEAGIQSV
jgi:hypothetical protein